MTRLTVRNNTLHLEVRAGSSDWDHILSTEAPAEVPLDTAYELLDALEAYYARRMRKVLETIEGMMRYQATIEDYAQSMGEDLDEAEFELESLISDMKDQPSRREL